MQNRHVQTLINQISGVRICVLDFDIYNSICYYLLNAYSEEPFFAQNCNTKKFTTRDLKTRFSSRIKG